MATTTAVYAEILVDIPSRQLGDRLFTYLVPPHLAGDTFVGAQVLVPFGQQEVVGGYVVALTDRVCGDFTPKEIAEVVDTDPLFDREYVEFLHWVADYYCASLSSVVAAAVPADIGPHLRRTVELACADLSDPATTEALERSDPDVGRLLAALRASTRFSLSLRALRQRSKCSQRSFYRALSRLRQERLVTLRTDTTAGTTPKVVQTVVWTGRDSASRRQESIVSTLRHAGGQMPLSRLIEAAATTRATIKRMAGQGIVSLVETEVLRCPLQALGAEAPPAESPPELTDLQAGVFAVLEEELSLTLARIPGQDEPVHPWLLHGVTGSGKTEIYLRLIARTLEAGRSALLLVPEISLTPQLARRLTARFGRDVALWHSGLSAGERYDTWRRLRAGDARVLLGARSAALTSLPGLGLIIMDEEHESSYKQTSPSPRYHARRLALEKARRAGAMVLLGSATPDVGSFDEAVRNGRLVELPVRIFQQALPQVALVDMRKEFAAGNRSIFSLLLKQSLESCLERREQAILLMNRRGFANHVFCRACGHVVRCRSCSVSMVWHQPGDNPDRAFLACHHCGSRAAAGFICPACNSPFLRQYGLGTQRVEQDLRREFPAARILRLDSDVAARRGAHDAILGRFARGEADVLIGTQMVAKGLDIAAVTLVGVLAADAAFNLPDYRSVERGFQLLTQVSGRAGRGDRPGLVVMQTYDTEMPAIHWAKHHDYRSFVEAETAVRRALEYPPFSQLIRAVVSGADSAPVEAACDELAEELTAFLEDEVAPRAVTVLGPAPCLIERVRGKYRHHLLIKNLAGEKGRRLITSFLRHRRLPAGLSLAVDVDACDIL